MNRVDKKSTTAVQTFRQLSRHVGRLEYDFHYLRLDEMDPPPPFFWPSVGEPTWCVVLHKIKYRMPQVDLPFSK